MPIRVDKRLAEAVAALAGPFPPSVTPTAAPTGREPVVLWAGAHGLGPEGEIKAAIERHGYLWRRLGLKEQPRRQEVLPGAGRLDLIASYVVVEAKRKVTKDNGPAQIERYLDWLTGSRPSEGPWRGILVQCDRVLDDQAAQRVRASSFPLEVWAIVRGRMRWAA